MMNWTKLYRAGKERVESTNERHGAWSRGRGLGD